MNSKVAGGAEEATLDDFAAELVDAVYPSVLPHGGVRNWLALEMELWQVMKKTVVKWAQDWPQAGVILLHSSEGA
jgi:hypothetical protein